VEPADRIPLQDWMKAPATRGVMAALTDGGSEARFVGGCVRDAVIGRPVKDIDIATTDPPDIVTRKLASAGIKVVPTGIAHGTVTAVAAHRPFEITTLRHDVETFGRHAKVAFTDDWQADAARRDFTMNALSCRPDGGLFDYFGGLADLRAGRVRFVGEPEARIAEDVLRLLRFYRFLAHYGRGEADGAARAACRAAAAKLEALSGERLREETVKLLAAPAPHAILALMAADGVTAAYLWEATALDRLENLVAIEGALAGGDGSGDALLRLAALIGPAWQIGETARRLRFSNKDRDRLVALHADAPAIPSPAAIGPLRRLFYRHGAPMILGRALLAAAGSPAADLDEVRRIGQWAAAWQPIALPVNGADALALGVPEGEAVGRVLRAVEEWWIEADFRPERGAALARLAAAAEAEKAGRKTKP
jgi:poly(A) polymerase